MSRLGVSVCVRHQRYVPDGEECPYCEAPPAQTLTRPAPPDLPGEGKPKSTGLKAGHE